MAANEHDGDRKLQHLQAIDRDAVGVRRRRSAGDRGAGGARPRGGLRRVHGADRRAGAIVTAARRARASRAAAHAVARDRGGAGRARRAAWWTVFVRLFGSRRAGRRGGGLGRRARARVWRTHRAAPVVVAPGAAVAAATVSQQSRSIRCSPRPRTSSRAPPPRTSGRSRSCAGCWRARSRAGARGARAAASERLAQLDDAIARSREPARRTPGDSAGNEQLFAAYQQKIDFLAEAVHRGGTFRLGESEPPR